MIGGMEVADARLLKDLLFEQMLDEAVSMDAVKCG